MIFLNKQWKKIVPLCFIAFCIGLVFSMIHNVTYEQMVKELQKSSLLWLKAL